MTFLSFVLGGVLGLASVTGGQEAVPDKLRVCVAELQPWIYVDEDDGLRGFEVDAVNDLAAELGAETEFVVRDFDQLKPSLMAGECDIIASGFSITFDRIEDISFSVPYNHTEYRLLVPSRRANAALEAFDTPETRIGHLAGGVSGDVAREYFPSAQYVGLPDRMASLEAFREGRIDAYVASAPFDEIIDEVAPGEFAVVEDELLQISIEAFAVRKDNDALLDRINPFIVRGVNENYFLRLHRKWFSSDELLIGY
jgi:polar amino acid transport system substrate-binding protein